MFSTISVIIVAAIITAAEIWVYREVRKRAKTDPEYAKRMAQAMSRHIFLAILSLVLSGSAATAQTWVEQRTDVKTDQNTLRVDGWISGNITATVGTFAWFQVDENYAEAYAGPSFSPKPWLQFGAGAGVEQTAHPLRLGSFIWAGNQRVQFLFMGEGLGSGWWYKSECNWNASKKLGLGLMTERFKGTGPRIQYSMPHTPLTVWSAFLFEQGGNRALLGIRAKI
jgi:hypothetical protein